MRHLLAALLLVLTFSFPAQAVVVSGQCSLDEAVSDGGQDFNQCPFGDEEGFLIDQGYNGARLQPDDALSSTPIWVHNICRYVDARGLEDPLFIPFNTAQEWQAFTNNVPTGVNTAECCVPRPLRVGDVPPITAATNQTCSTGWVFDGLVNPSNFNQLLAAPNGPSDTATFTLQNGITENEDYPITSLPIQRDDIGAMLPQGASGGQSYVAKYRCTVTQGNSTTTNVQLIQFALTCEGADWVATGPTCQSGPFEIFSQPCPGGGSGTIVKALVRACPSQAVTVQELSNTCSGGTCVPGQVGDSYNVACPPPQGGLITRINVRQCPSGQIVTQDIASTCQLIPCSNGPNSCPAGATNTDCVLIGNQCTCTCTGGTCPGSTTLPNTTQECPTQGQTGQITFSNTRTCSPSNNQCVCSISSTQVSNTCTGGGGSCAPVTVTTETRQCPQGQNGSITVQVTKLCFSRKPVGAQSVTVNDGSQTCYCVTNEQQTANTCTNSCPAVTDLGNSTETCPSGQVGQVIVNTKRLCTQNGAQCNCHNEKTTVTSACEVCPASTDYGNVIEACPAGQDGQITRHHTATCTVSNNQCTCQHNYEEVSNTCTNSCPATTDLGQHTLSCPSGQTGSIVVQRTKSCTLSGDQCNCTVSDTVISDTCTTTECPHVTDLGTETRQCPSGQNGEIVVKRKKICTSCFGQCLCSIQEIPISNTCCAPTCVPETDLGNTTQACPEGQTGQIVINTKKICEQAFCPAVVGGGCEPICSCHNQQTEVSNTCVPVCTPVTDLGNSTQACPTGQTGQIVINTKRICAPVTVPIDGVDHIICACHNETSTVSNTCEETCTPSTRTVCRACPAGQSGSIVRTIAHICDCPGGRDVVVSEDKWCFPTDQTYFYGP